MTPHIQAQTWFATDWACSMTPRRSLIKWLSEDVSIAHASLVLETFAVGTFLQEASNVTTTNASPLSSISQQIGTPSYAVANLTCCGDRMILKMGGNLRSLARTRVLAVATIVCATRREWLEGEFH